MSRATKRGGSDTPQKTGSATKLGERLYPGPADTPHITPEVVGAITPEVVGAITPEIGGGMISGNTGSSAYCKY